MHSPIIIDRFDLSFPHKIAIRDFSTLIHSDSRIAIIGRNGAGKSSLLEAIYQRQDPAITIPDDCHIGYVRQITAIDSLSGGEAFQSIFSEELRQDPNLLLLDEPTNHLDQRNRQHLLRRLEHFNGSILLVSHDEELLHHHFNTFWHIHDEHIYIFNGNYADYLELMAQNESSLQENRRQLRHEKRANHERLMQQQQRAASSRRRGEKLAAQNRWAPIVANQNRREAERNAGQAEARIRDAERSLNALIVSNYQPKLHLPSFFMAAEPINHSTLINIKEGEIGYDKPLITNINFSLQQRERVAITGNNGSGKTSFIRALLIKAGIVKENAPTQNSLSIQGDWEIIEQENIGYLDQHYGGLTAKSDSDSKSEKTVLEIITEQAPTMSHADIRDFLNGFLFRKNEEVNAKISTLSGGEKARLSLALITLKTPALLILDEVTNNLDLETKHHIIQVLTAYQGAIIAISHDTAFLQALKLDAIYTIEKNSLTN